MATRKAPANRTTNAARPTCVCPLCNGTTVAADGVFVCRAGERIEYIGYHQGEPLVFKSTELAAKAELNKIRQDRAVAPVEDAAAEADYDAQAAAFVAEVAAAQPVTEDFLVSEWKCAVVLYGNFSDEALAAWAKLDEFRGGWSYICACGATAQGPVCEACKTDEATQKALRVCSNCGATSRWTGVEHDCEFCGIATTDEARCACGGLRAGDGCSRRQCVNFPPSLPTTPRPALLPLEYKPYIYYSAAYGGLTFEGAGRSYTNWVDANLARAEFLNA